MTPLLSICVPTYNRAEILNKSLESLVHQDIFQNTDDVEIIISDNASSDKTKEVVSQYVSQFGDKIKYFRNDKNINDENFWYTLAQGNGDFLKLCNDKLIFKPNSLERMLNYIKTYEKNKPVLFF